MIQCPECGSIEFSKAGMRYLSSGDSVQRFICEKCGYRFSQNTNSLSFNKGKRQICVTLQGAKNLTTTAEIKTAGDTTPTGNNELILDFAWHMKKKGLTDATIKLRTKMLNYLVQKGGNLLEPDGIETILAVEQWKTATKHILVQCYFAFCKYKKIVWEKVKVNYTPKQVYRPTQQEIDLLKGHCRKELATFITVLENTGARKGEAQRIRYADVNSNANEISINYPEKGSRSRKVKVSEETIAMINRLPKKHGENIFNTHPHAYDNTFSLARKRIANTYQKPNILKIHFHTFRYMRARKEYAKHKSIQEAKYLLGHKSILNTDHYTEGIDYECDQYFSAEAKTKEEAKKLIEDDWTYVMDIDGVSLFRKPK